MGESGRTLTEYEQDQIDMLRNKDFKHHVDMFTLIEDMREKIRYVINIAADHTVEELAKDTDKANDFLMEGKEALDQSKYKDAIDAFTNALKMTPHSTEDSGNQALSDVFAWRSVALFQIKKIKACLEDVERALSYSTHKENEDVLNKRREFCINQIKCGSKKYKNGEVFERPSLPVLYNGMSDDLIDASAAVQLKTTQDKGRYIEAKENIPIGKMDLQKGK